MAERRKWGRVIEAERERLRRVWEQQAIPVLYRRGAGQALLMRLPYSPTNRAWLQRAGRIHPKWIAGSKHWELPQAWFNRLVRQSLDTFGRAYIIQPYREQEKCAPACWNAEGDECQCSCMGANHGSRSSNSGWRVVSDTFATRWGDRHIACRLVTRGR